MQVNPYLFSFEDSKVQGLIIINVFITTIIFPLVSVAMLKLLGFIQSVHMEDRMERVGPMIITGIFYIWLYLNIKNNDLVPDAFSYFVLGCTIALFLAFFINIFSKVSLHAVGIGGFVAAIAVMYASFSYTTFSVASWTIAMRMLVVLAIVAAGMVCTSRLLLGAHRAEDVYGGLTIGVTSQLLAYAIVF
jgi:lipid-A-disaccharide synthase-like uncharacterized protein